MPLWPPTPEPIERLPFLTGSRAYGEPRDDSDVDIFMLVESLEFARLEEAAYRSHVGQLQSKLKNDLAEKEGREDEAAAVVPAGFEKKQKNYQNIKSVFVTLRSGSANLLITKSPQYYDCWKQGTRELQKRQLENTRPIPREEACSHIKGLCQAAGFDS